jgi:hypothetical protein
MVSDVVGSDGYLTAMVVMFTAELGVLAIRAVYRLVKQHPSPQWEIHKLRVQGQQPTRPDRGPTSSSSKGPQPQTVTPPQQPLGRGGLGLKQPAAVGSPDSAATGVQPRRAGDEGLVGDAGPVESRSAGPALSDRP